MYLIINKKRLKDNVTNKELEFTKIEKNKNNIYCYKHGNLEYSFQGISNINLFSVEGGEFTVKKSKEELQAEINAQLLKDSANLQIQLKKQQELNANLLIKIAQIGGNVNA